VIIVVTIVVLGLVFGLVTWRRRATARWRSETARHPKTDESPWCTKVWVQ
jgi:hypothetical protein